MVMILAPKLSSAVPQSWPLKPRGHDPETSLGIFDDSHYDPYTGRWLQRDPIGFSGGDTNLYGYGLQDPVNRVDPSGKLSPVGVGIAVYCNTVSALELIDLNAQLKQLQAGYAQITAQVNAENDKCPPTYADITEGGAQLKQALAQQSQLAAEIGNAQQAIQTLQGLDLLCTAAGLIF
jgi:RHS repeat-associated protein